MTRTDVPLIHENVKPTYTDEKLKDFKRSVSNQVKLALLTNFSSIAPSMSLGFSAIAIPALKHLSAGQISWFASIASLATPFGCFFSGPVADRFGRRCAISLINVTCFLGWLTIASAFYISDYQYPILLIGRLLTGLSTGLSSVPATVYMAEISSPKLRSVFTTWSSISFALGVLVVYFLGYVLENLWGTVALISAAFPCLGMVFVVFFVPESPAWLVGKNRIDDAKSSLSHIFGTKYCTAAIQQEIDDLIRIKGVKKNNVQKTVAQQALKKLKHILKPTCLRPLGLVLTYFFFQQFTGTMAVVFYAIDVVNAASIHLDPYLAIVLIGVTRFITAVIVSAICRKYGRRPLSIISGSGMAVTMIGLGVYITLIRQGKMYVDTIGVIPMVLLLLYFITSTLGFLPLPFALSAEVFPTKIRGTAAGLANSFNYLFNFVTVKLYPNMVTGLGSEGVFYFYGGMAVLGTVFIMVFLPETKGKTLEEILDYFKGDEGRDRRENNDTDWERREENTGIV